MSRLEGQTAQVVLDTIEASPGIHFRGLLRRAGLSSAGQLRHHLDRLRQSRRIIEVADGGFTRYFAAGAFDRRLREEMLRFSRPIARRLARLLLRGSMPRTEIRRSLRCADSTLGYYLSRMRQEGVLRRRAAEPYQHYALADPEGVRRVLEAQTTQAQLIGSDEAAPGNKPERA